MPMQAETVTNFAGLEELGAKLRALFEERGFEPVAPAILQPAGLLLDCLGEALRARTYVFSDRDGDELCLRPDLTIPAARIYLERNSANYEKARYCYNGPAFRYSPSGGKSGDPAEFRQMGVEIYADHDLLNAEAEILRLMVDAMEEAGLEDYQIRIGDVGMFGAIIDAIEMPRRWRDRLKHHFWNPDNFARVLHELAENKGGAVSALGKELPLDPDQPKEAAGKVAEYLEKNNIELIGVRTIEEITARLLEMEMDARQEPLDAKYIDLIDKYLKINHPPSAALIRFEDLSDLAGINIKSACSNFRKRLEIFESRGIDLSRMKFSGAFGRDFEYYTGFVFHIELVEDEEISPDDEKEEAGRPLVIAGGGRYDRLLARLGAIEEVPAAGCAIYTERLLANI